jgi:Holliday junction resolvase RusA-like endonuclease
MKIHFTAKRAWEGPPLPKGTPVSIDIRFVFRRPTGHFRIRGGKPSDILKPGAPTFPVAIGRHGDLDKLERNAWDAMSGVCFADDVDIVDSHATKIWGEDEGAMIKVKAIR